MLWCHRMWKIARLPQQMLDSQKGLYSLKLLRPRRSNDKKRSKVFHPLWRKWLGSHLSTGYDSTDTHLAVPWSSDSRKPYTFGPMRYMDKGVTWPIKLGGQSRLQVSETLIYARSHITKSWKIGLIQYVIYIHPSSPLSIKSTILDFKLLPCSVFCTFSSG
jgi:hypothetical protein